LEIEMLTNQKSRANAGNAVDKVFVDSRVSVSDRILFFKDLQGRIEDLVGLLAQQKQQQATTETLESNTSSSPE